MELVQCPKFTTTKATLEQAASSVRCIGTLLPLSDYGQEGASLEYKAWACSNPNCKYVIHIDKGTVHYANKGDGERR